MAETRFIVAANKLKLNGLGNWLSCAKLKIHKAFYGKFGLLFCFRNQPTTEPVANPSYHV
jgi:hypothetical protein